MFHCCNITKIHVRGLELLIDYCKLLPSSPGSVICTNGSLYPQYDNLSVRNLWLPLLWLCLSYLQAAAHPPLVLDPVPGFSFLSTQTAECGLSSHFPTDPRKILSSDPQQLFLVLCTSETSAEVCLALGFSLAGHKPKRNYNNNNTVVLDFRFWFNLHGLGIKIAQPKFPHNIELVIN